MDAFRLPFVGFAARVSVGVAALVTFSDAMAMDEYVLYTQIEADGVTVYVRGWRIADPNCVYAWVPR